MKNLAEDIKTGQYKRVYLLYGSETYLRDQYKKKLLQALMPEEDSMNFARFEGKGQKEEEILELAETLPFFAERRVILLENSGFFKAKAEVLPDYISKLPDYLVLIFVENEVDKRGRMYKSVQKQGRAVEFPSQKEETLMKWILGRLQGEGRKISRKDMELLLSMTGTDMGRIDREVEKLLSYTMGREMITAADIQAVCVPQISNRIFEMIRAVSEKNQKKALEDYYDLLALKEPPMRILYLLAREYNLIFQVKELADLHCDQKTIASRTGLAPFIVKNYLPLARKYSSEYLQAAVEDFADAEERVKTGRLGDLLSVELMIIKYSR